MEVLVAAAVGAVLILGAATLIAPALQSGKQASVIQGGTAAGIELMNNVRVWSNGNWNTVLTLSTSSVQYYYLNTSASPFTVVSGTESVTKASTSYTRYFQISDVFRDSGGQITSTVSGNTYDPSTKQITLVYGATTSTYQSLSVFITRIVNNVVSQSDWSGGSGQSSPTRFIGKTFAAASNIIFSSSGQLQLATTSNGGGGTCNL